MKKAEQFVRFGVYALQLYEELFEIPFFESCTEFYRREAVRLREGTDCCTFMLRVRLRIFTAKRTDTSFADMK